MGYDMERSITVEYVFCSPRYTSCTSIRDTHFWADGRYETCNIFTRARSKILNRKARRNLEHCKLNNLSRNETLYQLKKVPWYANNQFQHWLAMWNNITGRPYGKCSMELNCPSYDKFEEWTATPRTVLDNMELEEAYWISYNPSSGRQFQ